MKTIDECNYKIEKLSRENDSLNQLKANVEISYENYLNLMQRQKNSLDDLHNIKNCNISKSYYSETGDIIEKATTIISLKTYEKLLKRIDEKICANGNLIDECKFVRDEAKMEEEAK